MTSLKHLLIASFVFSTSLSFAQQGKDAAYEEVLESQLFYLAARAFCGHWPRNLASYADAVRQLDGITGEQRLRFTTRFENLKDELPAYEREYRERTSYHGRTEAQYRAGREAYCKSADDYMFNADDEPLKSTAEILQSWQE